MKLNTIYRGDCEDVLSEAYTNIDKYFANEGKNLPKQFADLIYLDPPFFSGRIYETFWPDDKEVRQFRDNWGYGIDDLENNYLPYMRDRIQKCYTVLKKTGSFFLHCDWHASHYLKRLCDQIFGYENFQNEIIWRYGLGGSSPRRYQRKHDSILFYTKSSQWTFNPPMVPATSNKMKGELKKMDDVWDIPTINNMAKERCGYPTQKPEQLLERIIVASSNPGGIILDPFCGCGTTIAVAHKLGRNFIGIDVSRKACNVMKERLKEIGMVVEVIDSVTTEETLKGMDPWTFQQYIIEIGHHGQCKSTRGNDKGIDGFTYNEIPIQVKQCNVGRPIVDLFETALNRYYSGVGLQDKKRKGIIVGYYFTHDAFTERIRAKMEHNLDIEFETTSEILNNVNQRYITLEEMDNSYNKKEGEI